MSNYFSWSNRDNYGMLDHSSVVGYVCKRGIKAKINGAFIEFMMNTELISVLNKMKKYIPSCLRL